MLLHAYVKIDNADGFVVLDEQGEHQGTKCFPINTITDTLCK